MSRPAGPPRQSDEEISFYLLSLSSPPSLSLSSLCLLPFSLTLLSLSHGRRLASGGGSGGHALPSSRSGGRGRGGVGGRRSDWIRRRRRAGQLDPASATGGAAGSSVGGRSRDGFGISGGLGTVGRVPMADPASVASGTASAVVSRQRRWTPRRQRRILFVHDFCDFCFCL